MPELTREKLEEIHERADGFGGFEAKLHQKSLAELDEHGKWLYWDMDSPYSENALDFVRHSREDVLSLLQALAEAQARIAALEALVRCADELLAGSEPVLARIYDGGDTRDWVYKDDWRDEAAKLLEVGDV